MTRQIVLATGNPGKVAELGSMLKDLNIEILPQSQFNVGDVEETGTTFVENAIIKARHAAKITGLPAIADDSGLEVDALKGAPGVYSARYAGAGASDQDNIDKLLEAMTDVTERTARFWCVLVYMRHADDPTPVICQASWEGRITDDQQGLQGFGYDPVFWVEQTQCTSAQLSKEEKNARSHRGQALQQLLAHFKGQL
ncbi:RdgB/HAM1 family non-canonical purine NTP pyrophosphatase [Pseudoalteromonas sp. R3]|uniref:RdgB/HAM1 family non-canonical purine NTP pyrophosphatase n=1 Tax=Pseudoalteromonas sp. R3 TaxID=1709477 RepID=UPI0006B5C98F|nr:RdgB/HAM1 family non-canonical purine NTP pyrophosphatase [Pseudoalteromonas sp. R3]AZZ97126.1 RdgB/HAM1 family non-canonical purine NTP pyrophosphatase [Pseudoalteromonas sp. R3]